MIVGRRGRPASRAALGGLLVAAAAVIVFAAVLSGAGGHRTAYVVAARPLAAGTVIGPGDTTSARLALSTPAAAAAFRLPAPLIGRILAVPVQPGQLVESTMLSAAPDHALRPVSIAVDSVSVAALSPGQTVDVLYTPTSGGSGAGTGTAAGSGLGSGVAPGASGVVLVLRGATLISLGRADNGLLSGASGGTVVATLGVSGLSEAEQLIEAAHSGTVELVQAQPADGQGLGSGSGG